MLYIQKDASSGYQVRGKKDNQYQYHFVSKDMTRFFLRIVDYTSQITIEGGDCPLKRVLTDKYKAYLTDECLHPDLLIEARKQYIFRATRIKNHTYISLYHKLPPNKIITSVNMGRLQSHFFLKTVIFNFLYGKKLVFLHSSAFLVKGKAQIFIGDNGAGKSTIVKMLKKDFVPLCDDMAIIKIHKGRFYLYQVPYPEKNLYEKTNKPYPAAGLFLLKKAVSFSVQKIYMTEADRYFDILNRQISFDNNKKEIIKLIAKLNKRFFRLSFSKKSTESIKSYFSKEKI